MDWDSVRIAAEKIGEATDSDVLLYNGKIHTWADRRLLSACKQAKPRTNVLLVLVTLGGDPDAAYRMARSLKSAYSKNKGKVTVFTPSMCKSAGTIVVLGADEIAMSETGELGPLDVQMSKPDEIDELRSSFIVNDAFASLQDEAIDMLTQCARDLKKKTGANLSLKTAMPISAQLTGAVFGGIYSQIDPMHVGEAYRASRVALEYAKRLSDVQEDAITSLVSGYPSHSFVIDLSEAQKVLGKRVREATEDEKTLAEKLGIFGEFPFQRESPFVEFMSLSKDELNAKQQNAAAAAAAPGESQPGGGGGGEAAQGAEITPIRQGG